MLTLIACLFLIALITLIGHGIWVALAGIYRALWGEPSIESIGAGDNGSMRTPYGVKCAECGEVLRIEDRFCPVCGLSRSSLKAMDDLAIMARQLDRFLSQGKLDAGTHKSVMRLVEEEQARLAAPPRREAEYPAPRPSAPAPVEPAVLAVERNVERIIPAPNEIPAPPSEIPPIAAESTRRPRRSFTEMLETFMEESSIRWGELVGGLLIIGCSIALVVSLWSEIASKPFLKFSVFIGVTTAFFGLGFYSAHRWKLPTTSRGALIISTLLAPLNFLAMTAFSREQVPPSLPVVGGELFSLVLFCFLAYQAARVFLPEAPWMTTLATMGPSLAMLLARHSSAAEGGALRAVLLGGAPLLCYCASSGVILRDQVGRPKQYESQDRRADRIFTHLGVASFATLPPLGLLFVKPGHISQTLRQFAPLVSVFGVPAMAAGIALLQWPEENQSGKTRTAATSAVFIGSLIMLAALVFAWPNPVAVIVTALINCAVALAIALSSSGRGARYDFRLAHAGAIAHFSLAILAVANLLGRPFLRWSEDDPRLLESLFSKTSGYALAFLFAFLAAASEGWLMKGRKIESRIYGISAVFAGPFSLSLIMAYGFGRAGDPHHAALGCAFYAVAAFVIAWRREKVIASWIGNALSSLAILQTLAFKFGHALAEYHPARSSFLVFANVAAVAAAIVSLKGERARKLFARPLASSALIASVAVAPFLILGGWMTTAQVSMRLLWLAAIWFVIAWLNRSRVWFAAFQLALAASVVFKIADLFDHRWPHSFAGDLKTMQAQAVALAALSLAWIAARLALRRFAAAESGVERSEDEAEAPYRLFDLRAAAKLFRPGRLEVDRAVALSLLAFLAGLSLYGFWDGILYAIGAGSAPSAEGANPVEAALGLGSWALLAALALVFIAGLWERFEKRAAMAMLILLACACLLIAGRWREAGLTPAVYRWSSAIAFAAASFLIAARNRFTPWLKRLGWPHMEERSEGLAAMLRQSSIALFVAPVLILSSLSFFGRMIYLASGGQMPAPARLIAGLAAPLLIVGLAFIAHSVRERSAGYACAAGAMVNLSVTIGSLLLASARVPGVELAEAYEAAQLNVIATSICSLAWIWFHRRQSALGAAWPRSDAFLKTQTGLALFLSVFAVALADARLFIDPETRSALADSLGGVTGILAVALPALAYARFHDVKLDRLGANHLGVGLIVVGSLSSCLAGRLAGGGWVAFHALALALNAAAWLMLALRRPVRLLAPIARSADRRFLEHWITALALAIIAMTLRGVSSPGEPWWTTGFSVSICLLLAGLSLASDRRGYIYVAAPVLNFAATRIYFWLDLEEADLLAGIVHLNAVVLALPAIVWLAIDLKMPRNDETRRIAPFHRVAAPVSLLLLSAELFYRLVSVGPSLGQSSGLNALNWLSLASVIALFAACLWDEEYSYALCGLFLAGLLAAARGLLAFNPENEVFLVSAVVILSLYILATSALWLARKSLARLAAVLRMPSRNDDPELLIGISLLAGVVAYAITFAIVLSFDSLTKRMIASTASIAIPIAMAFLVNVLRDRGLMAARRAADNKSSLLNPISLAGFATWAAFLTFILWGWAWLSPVGESQMINRLAVVMAAAGAILIGYGFIAGRLAEENEWRRGAKGHLSIMAAIGITALAAILIAEAQNYALFRMAGAPWWVVIAVFAALVSLFCACIAFALTPKRDPFNLSERGRMNYAYVAEALTIVAVIHARLTMPWFFGGAFLAWWPLVVMLLAFIGVVLGELFRKRGKLVLAEPLERTGILLPILPVFGFWVIESQISYSNLLFLVGLFYGALSVMRRSFSFGILAAMAGNGGLWNLLNRAEGCGFHQHPQLWLIPAALSVLLAAHVNRDRLTKGQMTLTRYVTLTMIYVSSTSDIFINGARESLWLTIVLTLLSVMGVFVGLMLRIRAFLFLGTAFLILSLLTIILTALMNLNWGWLWYVTGIAFGAMIIITFALFEKKRREMLELVERLKQWQA